MERYSGISNCNVISEFQIIIPYSTNYSKSHNITESYVTQPVFIILKNNYQTTNYQQNKQ